jgi:hypothetical protein
MQKPKPLNTKGTKEHEGEGSDDLWMVKSGDLKNLRANFPEPKSMFREKTRRNTKVSKSLEDETTQSKK